MATQTQIEWLTTEGRSGVWVEAGDFGTVVVKHAHQPLGLVIPLKVYDQVVEPTQINRVPVLPSLGTADDQCDGLGIWLDWVWPASPTPLATLNVGNTYAVGAGGRVYVAGPIAQPGSPGCKVQLTRVRTPPD